MDETLPQALGQQRRLFSGYGIEEHQVSPNKIPFMLELHLAFCMKFVELGGRGREGI